MEQRRNQRREGGFTLIELIVVIAIIGALASAVVLNVSGRSDQANATIVKQDFKAIETACSMFKLDHRRWPDSLDELMNPPDLNNGDSESYLGNPPLDPWSREPYDFYIEGNKVVLVSYGADGTEGGTGWDSDIRSDEMDEQR